MIVLQSNAEIPIEVTFDAPGLYVGLELFVRSGSSWIASGSVIPAFNLPSSNTYVGLATPPASQFATVMRVYTDSSYVTPSDQYNASSQSFYVDPNFVNGLNSIVNTASELASTSTILSTDVTQFSLDLATMATQLTSFSTYLAALGTDITELNAIVASLEAISASLVSAFVPPDITAVFDTATIVGKVE